MVALRVYFLAPRATTSVNSVQQVSTLIRINKVVASCAAKENIQVRMADQSVHFAIQGNGPIKKVLLNVNFVLQVSTLMIRINELVARCAAKENMQMRLADQSVPFAVQESGPIRKVLPIVPSAVEVGPLWKVVLRQ